MITLGRTEYHDICFQNEMFESSPLLSQPATCKVSGQPSSQLPLSFSSLKMAVRICCSEWESDKQLKSDLERYMLANYSRQEILDFASRDFPEYAWSLPTLSRRLHFFGIKERKQSKRKWRVQGGIQGIEQCREKYESNINWLSLAIWSMMLWVWWTPKDCLGEGMLVKKNDKEELLERSHHW